jgi:hypothetical protein
MSRPRKLELRPVTVVTRLTKREGERLEEWLAKQRPRVSRSEAVRGMIQAVLGILEKE